MRHLMQENNQHYLVGHTYILPCRRCHWTLIHPAIVQASVSNLSIAVWTVATEPSQHLALSKCNKSVAEARCLLLSIL